MMVEDLPLKFYVSRFLGSWEATPVSYATGLIAAFARFGGFAVGRSSVRFAFDLSAFGTSTFFISQPSGATTIESHEPQK